MSDSALEILPFGFARRFGVLLDAAGSRCSYRADTSLTALAEVRRLCARELSIEVLEPEPFAARLAATYREGQSAAQQVAQGLDDELDLLSLAEQVPQTADLLEQQDDAPIIRLINALLSEAVREQASDIHLETFEQYLSCACASTAVARGAQAQTRTGDVAGVADQGHGAARHRRKACAAGRPDCPALAGHEVDVRVSTLPSAHGERVVLRLLDKQAGRLELHDLGMPDDTLASAAKAARQTARDFPGDRARPARAKPRRCMRR